MIRPRMKIDAAQQMDGVLELYICDDVKPDFFGIWGLERSETSQNSVIQKLEGAGGVTQIHIYINSAGGSVKEGYGIYAALKRHPAKKTVYIDGFAYSIASVIALAGDEIIMYPHSVMGIHNISDVCDGTAEEHRKCAQELDKIMEGNRQVYLQRAAGKITPEQLEALLDAETILTAQECLEYGFCDRIEAQENPIPEEAGGPAQYRETVKNYRYLSAFWKDAGAPQREPSGSGETTLEEFINHYHSQEEQR